MTVPITDLQGLAEKILVLAQVNPDLNYLALNIAAAIATHPDDWTVPLSPADRTDLLRALTGFVVALNCDIACYPLGYTTTILFDEDGNLL